MDGSCVCNSEFDACAVSERRGHIDYMSQLGLNAQYFFLHAGSRRLQVMVCCSRYT